VLFKLGNAASIVLTIIIVHHLLIQYVPPEKRADFSMRIWAVALIFQPFWTVFRVGGQVSPTILLLFCIGLALHLYARPAFAAACLAVIVLIKPVFLPGALFLAIAGGTRFFVSCMAAGLAIAAVSIGLFGVELHLEFFERVRSESSQVWPGYYNSAITSPIDHLLGVNCSEEGYCLRSPALLYGGFVLRGAAAAIVIFAFIRAARHAPKDARLILMWIVGAIAPIIFTPVAWAHYLTVLFPLLALAIAFIDRLSVAARAIIGTIVVVSILQNLILVRFLLRHIDHFDAMDHFWFGLAKSLPVWLTVSFFAFFGRSIAAIMHAPVWEEHSANSGARLRLLLGDSRIRFVLAGGALAVLNWLLRFPLNEFLSYDFSVTISGMVMMAIGYFIYRKYVFSAANNANGREALIFIAINLVGVIVTAVVSVVSKTLFVERSGLPFDDAKAIGHIYGIGAAAISNYLGHRFVTFNSSRRDQSGADRGPAQTA
jgi:putative flippase GtrA